MGTRLLVAVAVVVHLRDTEWRVSCHDAHSQPGSAEEHSIQPIDATQSVYAVPVLTSSIHCSLKTLHAGALAVNVLLSSPVCFRQINVRRQVTRDLPA